MSDDLEKSISQSKPQANLEKYQRAQPLVHTVSTLKGATNNIRSFANSFEELLNAIENFAPFIEMASQGKDNFLRALTPKNRGK